MGNKIHLSLIIPAYNQAKTIPLILIDADKQLYNVDFLYEILLIDGASSDDTKEVAEKFGKLIKNFRLISIPNKGEAAALKAGMLRAKGEYRAFVNAAGSISVDQVIDALPYFKNGYDVLVGSRSIKGGKYGEAWYHIAANLFGNLMTQMLLLPGFSDTQCPLKIFSTEAAERIFSISQIENHGLDIEVLSLASKMGYKIKQFPVESKANSRLGYGSYLEILWDIAKVRFKLWTRDYKFYIDAPPLVGS